jgi:methylated-DNA-[protein]-cysteine S-methyltransferase
MMNIDQELTQGRALAEAFPVQQSELDLLRSRLGAAAQAAGAIDVAYRIVDSPLGPLLLGATNPIPLVVPCHRAVRSDGSTGTYRGGPQAKRILLALERAA